MKNKKALFVVIALVAVIGLMLGAWFATRPQAQQGSKVITVQVIHKDGSTKSVTYHTDEEYLDKVLLAQNLITGYEDQYGLVVETVDGERADWQKDNAYWAIYIGEEAAITGISEILVTDGAAYKLVYTPL